MSEDRPLFILAGNGPYENRGCEAIVRGTAKILREYFKDPQFICISHFDTNQQYRKQCLNETDSEISHLSTYKFNRWKVLQSVWKPSTWTQLYQYFFNTKALKYWTYQAIYSHLDKATAVLSVGGDNYAIYSGLPSLFTDLDDIVLERGKPLVIWGGSVGPFNDLPDYEQYMCKHLKEITGIFARESATIEYLNSIGITKNVYSVADPAFVMDPIKPLGIQDELTVEEGAIGINLSPLMSTYVTGGDIHKWTQIAANIINKVVQKTELPVYLIPHVTIPHSNDHEFMQKAQSLIQKKYKNITLLPAYNAAETKWIISQMTLFAGARTHSTIAALSSGVPTLSFSYSIKSLGINRDIFGNEFYVIRPNQLSDQVVVEKITSIYENAVSIRTELERKIPEVIERAWQAGSYLRDINELPSV